MTVMWASVWGLIGSLTMLLVFAMVGVGLEIRGLLRQEKIDRGSERQREFERQLREHAERLTSGRHRR